MEYVKQCIACGSRQLSYCRAYAAPFLLERIGASPSARQPVQLVRCQRCSMVFFNPRLNEREMSLLYRDYRGVQYQRMRQRHEPNYTREFNKGIGSHAKELANRKGNTAEIIRRHAQAEDVRSILDFGGDRGQFIPEDLAPNGKVVFDISGCESLPGITTVPTLEHLQGRKFDLIMCSHVLEHVSKPLDVLETLRTFGHRDTLYYFEVPLESPFDVADAPWSLRTTAWNLLFRIPFALRLVQDVLRRGRFYMHEHVNLFSINSLQQMLSNNSFIVLEARGCMLDIGWTDTHVGCCLCMKRTEEPQDPGYGR